MDRESKLLESIPPEDRHGHHKGEKLLYIHYRPYAISITPVTFKEYVTVPKGYEAILVDEFEGCIDDADVWSREQILALFDDPLTRRPKNRWIPPEHEGGIPKCECGGKVIRHDRYECECGNWVQFLAEPITEEPGERPTTPDEMGDFRKFLILYITKRAEDTGVMVSVEDIGTIIERVMSQIDVVVTHHVKSGFAWECPVCKAYGDSLDEPRSTTCPECGASMEGK